MSLAKKQATSKIKSGRQLSLIGALREMPPKRDPNDSHDPKL
jgi:hypothetical protein